MSIADVHDVGQRAPLPVRQADAVLQDDVAALVLHNLLVDLGGRHFGVHLVQLKNKQKKTNMTIKIATTTKKFTNSHLLFDLLDLCPQSVDGL